MDAKTDDRVCTLVQSAFVISLLMLALIYLRLTLYRGAYDLGVLSATEDIERVEKELERKLEDH